MRTRRKAYVEDDDCPFGWCRGRGVKDDTPEGSDGGAAGQVAGLLGSAHEVALLHAVAVVHLALVQHRLELAHRQPLQSFLALHLFLRSGVGIRTQTLHRADVAEL
jgi:hypothetical protein